MKLSLGEHIFITGRTGSGKTYLASAFANKISNEYNIIVHDTKGTESFSRYRIYTTINELMNSRNIRNPGIFVYRPRFQELDMQYYEIFYEWIYHRKNCIVLIDEAMQVCERVDRYPKYLKGIMTRGREYNIAAWVCTQRPKTLPMFLLSEATKFYVFELNLAEDRRRLVEITGREELMQRKLCEYCFHYYDVRKNKYYIGKVVKG